MCLLKVAVDGSLECCRKSFDRVKPKLPQLQMWFPVKGEAEVICRKKLSNIFLVNSSRTVAPLFREAFPFHTYTIPALKNSSTRILDSVTPTNLQFIGLTVFRSKHAS